MVVMIEMDITLMVTIIVVRIIHCTISTAREISSIYTLSLQAQKHFLRVNIYNKSSSG
jgi:hypothetical protein